MNDYWNDPPDDDWPPDCCDEIMEFNEETSICKCSICGRVILPAPDIEPTVDPEI